MKYDLSLNKIRDVCLSITGLSPAELFTRNKKTAVVARCVFTYLAKQKTSKLFSLREIAEFLKMGDHSSVSHYVKMVRDVQAFPKSDPDIYNALQKTEDYLTQHLKPDYGSPFEFVKMGYDESNGKFFVVYLEFNKKKRKTFVFLKDRNEFLEKNMLYFS